MCEINNNVITFKEKDATNIIDLNNKIYTRENNDYLMEVNVKTKLFKITLKEKNNNFSAKLTKCSLINKDKIVLKYQLDEEEKEIIIQIL